MPFRCAPLRCADDVEACHRCRATYLLAATPNRFFERLALYSAVAGTEDVVTHVERVASVPGLSRFILAAADIVASLFVEPSLPVNAGHRHQT